MKAFRIIIKLLLSRAAAVVTNRETGAELVGIEYDRDDDGKDRSSFLCVCVFWFCDD